MCGIFGFTLKYNNPEVELRKMGKAMIHRGPDGEGYYFDSAIGMGMRRLSIIDIEKGNQPFYNKDRSVVVFCNGEIYNYKELRIRLKSKGYVFETNSDIEVIPFMYEEYGIDFIKDLNGMYAISLYDKKDGNLFLIRDRLGIKPLYYSVLRNEIVFSSEIKPILELGKVDKEIDYMALSVYLDLMYIPRPYSPFKHIKKLDSGTYLKWSNGFLSIKKYWDLKLDNNIIEDEKEAKSGIQDLIEDSIKLQLNSDVPLGSFLSGGIDSSIVTKLSALLSTKEFSVFHMQWKDIKGKIDESKYASQVIENMKVNRIFRDVNKLDVLNLIPYLIYHMEEPFADAAFLPTYYLSKIASENVTVILSGAGGDELFGGYYHYRDYSRFKSFIKLLLGKNAPAFSSYEKWKSSYSFSWNEVFPWYNTNYFKKEFDVKYKENKLLDKHNASMLNDINYYLQDDILFLTDKMTMAASIECRVPLLDHRLVEYAQKISSKMKVRGADRKIIFKKMAERFLPHDVLYRKKEGFGFPIQKWINEYKFLYFDPLIENGYLVKNKLINKHVIQHLILQDNLDYSSAWFYWHILVLEIWFKLYIEGVNYADIYKV